MMQRLYKPDVVLAEITTRIDQPPIELKLADVPAAEKLEKFVEDVKWVVHGLYSMEYCILISLNCVF